MARGDSFCPMVGTFCLYDSTEVKPNSFFLIQPFDKDKEKRENAIETALKKYYRKGNYQLKKSDSTVHIQGSYCDICKKIQSCQYCIADISGEIFKVLIEEKSKEKVFLRPNIAFEIGLAYGFGKPSLILSKKLIEDHHIPSDINFIRYIDITVKSWSMVSQKLLDLLRNMAPHRALLKSATWDYNLGQLKREIASCIVQKEALLKAKDLNYKINQVLYLDYKLIGIIKNALYLIEGTYFDIYILEGGVEIKRGVIRIELINREKKVAQVEFDYGSNIDYWIEIAKICSEKGKYILNEHRLELIIPKHLEQYNLHELKQFLSLLDKAG
ncbi:MAG: hypothetical protein MUO26_10045 [Methanotrichaceae archaeon]|nr:hypothetical protein [Methanotrichaceae archaeon]